MVAQAHALVAALPTAEATQKHADAVAELAIAVADELELDEPLRRETELVGLLHDVGKAETPAEILAKPGPLNRAERGVMELHTIRGQQLLERAGPPLEHVGRLVRSCHERVDGGGYPDGLEGDEIPVAARIVFCCDAYDAMTTDRPYRRGMSHAAAAREIRAAIGTQFDLRVAGALLRVVEGRRELAGSTRPPLRLPARPVRRRVSPVVS